MTEPKQITCPECDGAGSIMLPTEQTRGVWPPDEAPPPVCPVCNGEGVVSAPDGSRRR